MANAPDSGSGERNLLQVQILLSAPKNKVYLGFEPKVHPVGPDRTGVLPALAKNNILMLFFLRVAPVIRTNVALRFRLFAIYLIANSLIYLMLLFPMRSTLFASLGAL